MTHNELAQDLAEHIRRKSGRLVWMDMQLGPSGSPRPDVYSIEPSFAKFRPIAYEIKVSVADYRRDVTTGKWQSYLPYSSGIVFAVPLGLIEKKDLPQGCGLMVRSQAGWTTLKAPTLNPIMTLPHEAWCKLLIDGIGREVARWRNEAMPEICDAWMARRSIGKKLGEDVRRLLDERGWAESRFKEETQKLKEASEGASAKALEFEKKAMEQARLEASKVDGIRLELAVALGLPADSTVRAIQNAAQEQAFRLAEENEVYVLRRALRNVQKSLNDALKEPALASVMEDGK